MKVMLLCFNILEGPLLTYASLTLFCFLLLSANLNTLFLFYASETLDVHCMYYVICIDLSFVLHGEIAIFILCGFVCARAHNS